MKYRVSGSGTRWHGRWLPCLALEGATVVAPSLNYLQHLGPEEKEKSWLSFSPEVVTSLSDRSIINTLSSQDKSAKDFPRRFWRENKYIGFCGEHLRGVIYSGREEYIRVFVTKEENFSLRNWSLCGSTYKGKLGFKYRIQKKENNVKAGKP